MDRPTNGPPPGQRSTPSGRPILPHQREIRRYWAPLLWRAKGFRSREAFEKPGSCFACRARTDLDRAHIVARVERGPDTVENLHMLCHVCHQDSEVLDGQVYWIWFLLRSPIDGDASRLLRIGWNFSTVYRKFRGGELEPGDRITELVTAGKDFRSAS